MSTLETTLFTELSNDESADVTGGHYYYYSRPCSYSYTPSYYTPSYPSYGYGGGTTVNQTAIVNVFVRSRRNRVTNLSY